MMYKQEFDNKGEGKYESNINVVDIPIYGSSRLGTDNKEQTIKTVFYADIVDGKFSKYTGSVNLTSTTISGSGSIFSGNKIGLTGSGSGLTIELYSAKDSVYMLDTTMQVTQGELISGADGVKILAPLTYVEISTDDTLNIDSLISPLQYRVVGTPTALGPGQLQITPGIFGNTYVNTLGRKQYELSNHLGNVLTVVKDNKIPVEGTGVKAGTIEYFSANVDAYSDYYPFGSIMPGRNYSSGDYRYGFNSMEKDDEIKSITGSSYDFGARMYDPRIGRWMSIDPQFHKQPGWSTYKSFLNNPIKYVDPDGEVEYDVFALHDKKSGKTVFKVVYVSDKMMTPRSPNGKGPLFVKRPNLDILNLHYRIKNEDGTYIDKHKTIYIKLPKQGDIDYMNSRKQTSGQEKIDAPGPEDNPDVLTEDANQPAQTSDDGGFGDSDNVLDLNFTGSTIKRSELQPGDTFRVDRNYSTGTKQLLQYIDEDGNQQFASPSDLKPKENFPKVIEDGDKGQGQ